MAVRLTCFRSSGEKKTSNWEYFKRYSDSWLVGLIIFTSQVSFWLQITLKSWRCDACSHVSSHLDVVGLKQLSVSGSKNTSVYILIHSYTHKHTDCFLDDWTLNLILYLGKNLWSWASRELKLADFWMEFGVREQTTHSCTITHTLTHPIMRLLPAALETQRPRVWLVSAAL